MVANKHLNLIVFKYLLIYLGNHYIIANGQSDKESLCQKIAQKAI
jgi:hypothetical protein